MWNNVQVYILRNVTVNIIYVIYAFINYFFLVFFKLKYFYIVACCLLWNNINTHLLSCTVLRFAATVDMSPQIAVNEQWRYIKV